MSIDEALQSLRRATAAQIREHAKSNLEDTYTRLVQLEAQHKAYVRVGYYNSHRTLVTWHWNG